MTGGREGDVGRRRRQLRKGEANEGETEVTTVSLFAPQGIPQPDSLLDPATPPEFKIKIKINDRRHH
jgi:hypothetical protein